MVIAMGPNEVLSSPPVTHTGEMPPVSGLSFADTAANDVAMAIKDFDKPRGLGKVDSFEVVDPATDSCVVASVILTLFTTVVRGQPLDDVEEGGMSASLPGASSELGRGAHKASGLCHCSCQRLSANS